jgi:hypothetical protein
MHHAARFRELQARWFGRGHGNEPRSGQNSLVDAQMRINLGPIEIWPMSAQTARFRPQLFQCAGQLLKKPPHGYIVLGSVSLQRFILRPFDRSYGLLLRSAADDLLLDAVADIDQHLAKTGEPLLRLPGVDRYGAMRRHEDFSTEHLDRIERFKPVEAIAVVDP